MSVFRSHIAGKRRGARFAPLSNGLLAFLLVLLDSSARPEAIVVAVEYPTVDNFTVVSLSCLQNLFKDPLEAGQTPATFLRNGSVITPDSLLVTVTREEADSISFVFTQEEEGFFSCRTARGELSGEVGLAGMILKAHTFAIPPLLQNLTLKVL